MINEDDIKITIPIVMTHELKIKLDYLSNRDEEVSGWLTGDYNKDGIYLDDILIPEQEVTGSSVDIDASSGPRLLKQFKEKCQRIIFHFHSHTNKMSTFWSSIDEECISSLMAPRKFFGFIVGAKEEYLTRVELREPFNLSIDNLSFSVKNSKEIEIIQTKLQKEVDKKVKEKVYTNNYNDYYNNYNPIKNNLYEPDDKTLNQELGKKIKYFHLTKKVVIISIQKIFADALETEYSKLKPKLISTDKPDYFDVMFEFKKSKKAIKFQLNVRDFLKNKIGRASCRERV